MELGEVRQLGRHRLLCGDAFNLDHVDRLLDGAKPNMLYCDPPYGMDIERDYAKRSGEGSTIAFGASGTRVRRSHAVITGDSASVDISPLLEQFRDVREQFWWGADYYIESIPHRNEGAWLVWDKRCTPNLDKMHGSRFEMCWSKQRHAREIIRYTWCGVFGMKPIDGKRVHPTQKPVGLAEWFLQRYSKPDALVCDLFAGSGSTLLACERMNRCASVMEISPDYCEVIIGRYERMTEQPRLMEAM